MPSLKAELQLLRSSSKISTIEALTISTTLIPIVKFGKSHKSLMAPLNSEYFRRVSHFSENGQAIQLLKGLVVKLIRFNEFRGTLKKTVYWEVS